MPKFVPLCEGEINEKRFFALRSFLEAYSLSDREALVVYEVIYSGARHYVGADLIARKLSVHGFSQSEVEDVFKTLFQPSKGHLKPYPSKKEVLCCMPDNYGIDAARVMRNSCFTTILPEYKKLEQEYIERSSRIYTNPFEWYPPRKVNSWDSNGEDMTIQILELVASDEVSHRIGDEIIYGTIARLEIKCKICGHLLNKNIEFTNQTFWGFEFQVSCPVCQPTYKITKDLRAYEII